MADLAQVDPRNQSVREIDLQIRGMTCAACAARIERRLNHIDGVTAGVNYASERANVLCSGEIDVETLIREIENVGYGAKVAPSPADLAGDRPENDARVRSIGLRLIVATVLFVPLCDLSVVFSLEPDLRFQGWQWLLVALAAPVVTYSAWPFHRAALKNARHATATMDTLVSMGIIAATSWSFYAMFFRDVKEPHVSAIYVLLHQSGGAIYLDVGAGVTTFLLTGRLFEAWSKRRTASALRALAAVGAKDVTILRDDETERRIAIADLRVGDRFVVRPGERVATDGEVLFGNSSMDLSAMTGEPLPCEVAGGDAVIGGTLAVAGRLIVRAQKVGGDTQLAHMMRLVAQAQTEKASVQRLADRISSVFVPVVMCLAVITLSGWLLAGATAEHSFSAGLAVLIIACPCALGLATPTALLVASGRAAQLGIFFKGNQSLESSRYIDTVVLDKTGTVTEGHMTVAGTVEAAGVDRATLVRLAGSLEQASEHAIAGAIVRFALDEVARLPQPVNFEALAGLGARGLVDGQEIVVGRELLFTARVADGSISKVPADVAQQCADWENNGHTAVLVARDGEIVGAVALADAIKPSAARAVTELNRLGLRCVLLTGDNEATARSVASEIGIDEVIAGALPHEKVSIIRSLQAEGRSVAMVGDGINDGPALAAANLGLAIGAGTDVAIAAADLILLRDELDIVPVAIELARKTLRTIRRNYAWAFGYNIAAIPLAAVGLLDPLIAGAAMGLSSGFVVWNSARLRRFGEVATPSPGPRTSKERSRQLV